MSNNKVVKSNALIQASYKITLQEQRMILCAISKLDSRGEIPKKVTVTAREFSELIGVSINEAYHELTTALENLFHRSIVIQREDELYEFRWIESKCSRWKGQGKVTFSWSEPVMQYISNLKGSYTDYRLRHIATLSSAHAIRIYELLMQYRTTRSRMISVKDFKYYLGIQDLYPDFKELKRSLLLPAIKQLNQKTNLNVAMSVAKDGRHVVALQFDFNEKTL